MDKLLSIIIPMYNSEKFIEKTLNSLLVSEKVLPYLEVLVINDGSKDRGPMLVQEFVEKHPDVFVLINKENGGHGSAINVGVDACTGKYFKVLDADDWMNTDGLESFVLHLKDNEEYTPDMILSDYSTYNIQTNVESRISISNGVDLKIQNNLNMEAIIKDWNNYKNLCCIHGITYNTAFYREQGCFLPEKVYYDDAYYYTVPASKASNVQYIPEKIYIYRIGDVTQSVSNESRVRRINQLEKVIRYILETEKNLRSGSGMKYWRLKTESTIADYFVTAFLRFTDRSAGRKIADGLYKDLLSLSPETHRRMKKKYIFLKIMNYLGRNDEDFQKLLKIRSIRKG